MEAAMAKQYASDSCVEIVNEALQVFGGSGYMKGMAVERAYRDAKICTIYEGTNEIQRVVIAASILGRMKKKEVAPGKNEGAKPASRKGMVLRFGSMKDRVESLVSDLKKEGIDFSLRVDPATPIAAAQRVVSAGQGIGSIENMELIKALAEKTGAAIGSSRPVAEMHKFVGMDRFVGMSGQKFKGKLYIA